MMADFTLTLKITWLKRTFYKDARALTAFCNK